VDTAPSITVAAAIIGTPQVGVAAAYTPAVVAGSPSPTRSGIQWTLDGVNISGATVSTYTPVSGDLAHLLRVAETWGNVSGSVTSTSAPATVVAGGSTGTFSLSWDASINDAGGNSLGTVIGYYILYDTVSRAGGGTYAYSQFVSGSSTLTGTVSGLTSGATYYATVVAYDGTNQGIPEFEVSKTV
jgi:hypothetical protein